LTVIDAIYIVDNLKQDQGLWPVMGIDTSNLSRRALMAMSAGLLGGALIPNARSEPALPSGDMMFADVEAYAALGDHRTASPGDAATTAWLRKRLESAGLTVDVQAFAWPRYIPEACALTLGGMTIDCLPAWHPTSTPRDGLAARLVHGANIASVKDSIALVTIPYAPAGSFHAKGQSEPVLEAIAAGASAVVALTDGPTGEVIALNAAPDLRWAVPVVLTGVKNKAVLERAAHERSLVTLVSSGQTDGAAKAENVVARKPGTGKTIVISTPKSGWFRCAGERGSGIAVFLALATWAARSVENPMLFLSTSGHEFEGAGAKLFLKGAAPDTGDVGLWLHIGANVACNAVEVTADGPRRLDGPSKQRGLMAHQALHPVIAEAFRGQAGYETPLPPDPARAPGETGIFLGAGYAPLIGMVGAHPLHHTPVDLPQAATSPEQLARVATALSRVISSVAART